MKRLGQTVPCCYGNVILDGIWVSLEGLDQGVRHFARIDHMSSVPLLLSVGQSTDSMLFEIPEDIIIHVWVIHIYNC